ncbi:MAG TPA: hypothetical protein VGS21_00255 [Acidimicrobiales bacterium]|nr:hypothetical protein [Acidimicrobiales bacterium]
MSRRLAQPDPPPDRLLAFARKVAELALRSDNTVNGNFLIGRAEDQYAMAIKALVDNGRVRESEWVGDELRQFSEDSRSVLKTSPVLVKGSPFRRAMDRLADSTEIGKYYNGTDKVDAIVDIARRRMGSRERLVAAEDATRAATCMLWREKREEDAILLYNELTDAMVRDLMATIEKGDIYLVEMKSRVVRKRLVLAGRSDDVRDLDASVSKAMSTDTVVG